MNHDKVAFVGGGNMTLAIVGGLLRNGMPADCITVSEPVAEKRARLSQTLPGVLVTADNNEAVSRSGSVVLSVKPQIIAAVCRSLKAGVQRSQPLVISIAAGPRIADIDTWLGGDVAIARVMPNQAALLQKGVSGLFANEAATAEQRKTAEQIMSAVGPVVTVGCEDDIDTVTAVSGSGPAYFFLLIDMLAKTGASLGLENSTAQKLAVETAIGAAALVEYSEESMYDLIARVRSPGGTTAAALDSLEESGVRDIFMSAVTAARDRAIELADQAHVNSQD